MKMKALLTFAITVIAISSACAQNWQVPLNTIPYGRGAGKNGFGSVANTGTGDLCLLNTAPPSFGTCSGSLPPLNQNRIFVGNASDAAVAVAMSGDCTIIAAGAITCTKTNGNAFGAFATSTDAANLTGTVAVGRLSGSYTGITGVGTIGTGTWQGTAIAAGFGGFGADISSSSGVPLFATGTPTFTSTSGTGNFLRVTNGTASGTTITGGVLNGTLGATTPSTIKATGLLVGAASSNVSVDFRTGSAGTQITTSDYVPGSVGSALVMGQGANTGNTYSFLAAIDIGGTTWNNLILQAGSGNVGIGTTSPTAQFQNTGTVLLGSAGGSLKTNNTGIGGVSGCLASDGATPAVITAGPCGTGLPGGGSLAQTVLNITAGTGNWFTEGYTNIAGLDVAGSVDCTGTNATVISTVMSTIKSLVLPNTCTLKVTGNDTIPAGTFLGIPCGARIQVDGAAVLIFNAETDDNTCQKFAASGAGAGAGGGIVKGLRFNRPEWWGAAGTCVIGGACATDDYGPLQQAINSAQASTASTQGQRPKVQLGCNKNYGVSTGLVVTPSHVAPMEIGGCAVGGTLGTASPFSQITGRSGFTGDVLQVTAAVLSNFWIHDFSIESYTDFEADTCLLIGEAGVSMLSRPESHVEDMRLTSCKHGVRVLGTTVSVNLDRVWVYMARASGSSANSSCVEVSPTGTDNVSETSWNHVQCDSSNNTHSSTVCFNFNPSGSGFQVTGTRLISLSCYGTKTGVQTKADGSSVIADFWCYSCQIDGSVANSAGFNLVTTGTGTLANIVIDKSYTTAVGTMTHVFNIDGSAGGTIKNIGIYGPYTALASLRGVRLTTATGVQIQGGRFDGAFTNEVILIDSCTGCSANNNILRTGSTATNMVFLGGTTDYSQACNNSGSGTLAPAAVSTSTASGTHNVYYASAYQSCPNN